MIYIDEVKNLRLYSKEFLLPRNGKDKKKNNAVFLLTPNFESSKWVINHKLIVNKYYNSYFLDKDVSSNLSVNFEIVSALIKEFSLNVFPFSSISIWIFSSFNENNLMLEIEANICLYSSTLFGLFVAITISRVFIFTPTYF